LKFKKSVFAFDNLLICLGSDISVTNNQGSVVSTLFQTVNTTATPTMYVKSTTPKTGAFSSSYSLSSDYSWLTSSQGTGIYLPQGNNDYRIELGTQTTPDYTTTDGSITNTANFTRAYLVHGNQPLSIAPAKYEYVVAPGITPTDMQTLSQTLASGSIYTVLNQDGEFHAIKYIPENSTAYVFFKSKNAVTVGLVKSVSQPSIINIKEYDSDKVLVTINSPNLNPVTDAVSGFISNPTPINLAISGDYTVVSNPNNASVNQQSNLLTLGFTVKDGFSNAIILQKKVATALETPLSVDKVSYYPNPATSLLNVGLTAAKKENGTIKIYALNGTMVYNKEVLIKQGFNLFPIVLENLNTGEYIIKLTTGDTNSTQKFIKL
jgi:chondroitin-sulfate-ABC endolyase/exolyase